MDWVQLSELGAHFRSRIGCWTCCAATFLLENHILLWWGWRLSKDHQAAHVFKIGLHGQRHPKLCGEEILCGHLAWVHTKPCAPTCFEVTAFLYLDATFQGFILDRHLNYLTRADEPWEEERRDAGIKLSSPIGVREELSEPVWHLWETLQHCSLLLSRVPVPRQSMWDFHHTLIPLLPAPWRLPASNSAKGLSASIDEDEVGEGVLVLSLLPSGTWLSLNLCASCCCEFPPPRRNFCWKNRAWR